jgi:hypothetical protein
MRLIYWFETIISIPLTNSNEYAYDSVITFKINYILMKTKTLFHKNPGVYRIPLCGQN